MIHSMTPDGQPRAAAAATRAAEVFESPAGANPLALHLADFVDAVRNRRAPKEPPGLALDAANAAHRANQAYRNSKGMQ
jgi:hypothetical protein